jgi:hypothetical protein
VDYAFAPGNEPRLKMLQQLLRDRTDGGSLDTTFVTGVATVAEFASTRRQQSRPAISYSGRTGTTPAGWNSISTLPLRAR